MTRIAMAFLMALPATASLCGCNRGADQKAVQKADQKAGHKWSGASQTGTVIKDGVVYPRVFENSTCDDRVYLVIAWTGGSGSGAGSNQTYANGKATGTVTFHPDNRQITWSCTTSDGARGAVVIDGQNFDLAKGAVFLVTLKDQKTTVDQVAVDMAKLQGSPVEQKLQAIGETEPRITAFLKASRGEK
jgi:hypothetical protein